MAADGRHKFEEPVLVACFRRRNVAMIQRIRAPWQGLPFGGVAHIDKVHDKI